MAIIGGMSATMQSSDPVPALGRMMVFIDGENLVFRYQEMVRKGAIPYEDVAYLRDVFVWKGESIYPDLNIVFRATYYTYVVGNEDKILEASQQIKKLHFRQFSLPAQPLLTRIPNNLTPVIFRKVKGK
jgi:hypothetical protein